MPKHKDMTGLRFGRLVVLERAENDAQQNAQWLCRCDCGNTTIVRGGALRQGRTVSCGCVLSEASRERMKRIATKHGHSDSPLYKVRQAMIERCYKPQNKAYKNYGGRGITVCDEWRDSFEAFYDWAISHGYKRGLEIDRINNDGPYSPDNCRWVTSKVNSRNTRNCVPVEVTDMLTGAVEVCKTEAEASGLSGISIRTMRRMMQGITTGVARYKFAYVVDDREPPLVLPPVF